MKYKKIVIKVGTSVLAKKGGGIDTGVIEHIASQTADVLDKGIDVILVSSGAIGCGLDILKLRKVPASLSDLQAAASIGQSELMRLYSEAFRKRKYVVGQILLTQDDFNNRSRYLNIKYTLGTLISKKAVPIINENDTVSTEEIKCGDNDRISSLVADLTEADMLLILTDVDGLYDMEGKLIADVKEITEEIKNLAGKKCHGLTKGGMATKLEAAERAVSSGIECFVANGKKENIVLSILEEKGKCTHFLAKRVNQNAKKRWIAYSSKVKGKIIVDEGAKNALIANNKSLLASGITGKEGVFKAGDVVGIADSKKREFARGVTNYASKEIERIKGLKTDRIVSILGYKDHDEVVHRDNLVIL